MRGAPATRIRILIMHLPEKAMVAHAFCAVLSRRFEVLVAVPTSTGALAPLVRDLADVVLIDMDPADARGLDRIAALRVCGAPRVIATCACPRATAVRWAQLALRAGAAGVVPMSSPFGEMEEAIERVHGGEVFIAQEIAADVAAAQARAHDLSARLVQVLGYALGGLTDRGIATTLAIKVATVRTELRNAEAKVGWHARE